jgi:hypothetical protein
MVNGEEGGPTSNFQLGAPKGRRSLDRPPSTGYWPLLPPPRGAAPTGHRNRLPPSPSRKNSGIANLLGSLLLPWSFGCFALAKPLLSTCQPFVVPVCDSPWAIMACVRLPSGARLRKECVKLAAGARRPRSSSTCVREASGNDADAVRWACSSPNRTLAILCGGRSNAAIGVMSAFGVSYPIRDASPFPRDAGCAERHAWWGQPAGGSA